MDQSAWHRRQEPTGNRSSSSAAGCRTLKTIKSGNGRRHVSSTFSRTEIMFHVKCSFGLGRDKSCTYENAARLVPNFRQFGQNSPKYLKNPKVFRKSLHVSRSGVENLSLSATRRWRNYFLSVVNERNWL